MRFIYVKSEQSKEKMLALGYVLAKEDKRNGMWVFRNKEAKTFACDTELSDAGIQFVLSDTLTF